MKTQPIKSSFDALLDAAKPKVKKAVQHVKDNPGVYATAGVGAYVGGKLLGDLREDTVEIGHTDTIITDTAGEGIGRPLGYKVKTEWASEPTLFQKIQDKIHNSVSINPDNAPDWLDNTQPYMVTKSGKLVMDEYGVLINPWYKGTPEEIIQNAASAPGFVRPSMDEFLGEGIMDSVSGGFAPDFQGGAISISDLDLDDITESIIGIAREAIDSLS